MTYILLVEDTETDEVLTLRVLRRHLDVDVVIVRDGAEALAFLFSRGVWLDRDGGMPEVVLLDLNLPKVSGLDVLRAVRSDPATRLLPVVVLTSSREDIDLFQGYAEGANSYVVKPVDFDDFSEAVARLGVYWHHVDHGPVAGRSPEPHSIRPAELPIPSP